MSEKTMTIDEFMQKANAEERDIDVCGDYTDDWAICYCGEKDFSLTEKGRERWAEVLKLEITEDGVVKLNHLNEEDADKMNSLVRRFFESLAGYVSCSLYDEWFNYGAKDEQEFEITVRQYRDRTVKVKATDFGKAREKAVQIADDMTDWDSVDHFFMTADEDGIMGED